MIENTDQIFTEDIIPFKENFYSYFGIFDFNIDYMNENNDCYLCRGIRFNLDFAKKIHKFCDISSDKILRSISASYIMNNYVDNVDIVKYLVPNNFWYPKSPSKETCIKLLKINSAYQYPVGFLCVINKWYDVIEDITYYKIEPNLNYLYEVNGLTYENFLDYNVSIYDTNFKHYDYNSILYEGYFSFSEEDETEYLQKYSFIDYSYDFIDIGPVISSSFENIIYKNNSLKTTFYVDKKELKYNFLMCYYVLNTKYHHPIEYSLALSNFISNCIYIPDLVQKHDVFYLYTYRICPYYLIEKICGDFPHLKYNAMVIYCFYPSSIFFKDIDPDIDIYSIAEFYNNKEVMDLMLKKHKEQGVWYRHLDFENHKNLKPPLKVTWEDKKYYGNLLTTGCFS